jgi:hypothetical protein
MDEGIVNLKLGLNKKSMNKVKTY